MGHGRRRGQPAVTSTTHCPARAAGGGGAWWPRAQLRPTLRARPSGRRRWRPSCSPTGPSPSGRPGPTRWCPFSAAGGRSSPPGTVPARRAPRWRARSPFGGGRQGPGAVAGGLAGPRRRPPGGPQAPRGCGRPCACGRPTWSTPWPPRGTRCSQAPPARTCRWRGVDWAVRPGVRLRLGQLAEVPPLRPPCQERPGGSSTATSPEHHERGRRSPAGRPGDRARHRWPPATPSGVEPGWTAVPAASAVVTTAVAARSVTALASGQSRLPDGVQDGEVVVDAAQAAGGGRPRVAAGDRGGLGPLGGRATIGSSRICRRPANAAGSRPSTRNPVRPWSTSVRRPPTAAATTGRAAGGGLEGDQPEGLSDRLGTSTTSAAR